MIPILQINLNHCRAATAQVMITAQEKTIKIILLQDPYIYNNKIYALPNTWQAFASNNREAWIILTDASFIYSPQLPQEMSIFLRINIDTETLLIGSQYIAPRMNLKDGLIEWQKYSQISKNTQIIIGGDYNAKSPKWGSSFEDKKGKRVRKATIKNDLIVVNDPHSQPTFATIRARGWPDLTLANAQAASIIKNWRVSEEDSLSDHKYIFFELDTTPLTVTSRRFKTKGANFSKFDRLLKGKLPVLYSTIAQVRTPNEQDMATKLLQETIIDICSKTLKKKATNRKPTFRWWTPELASNRNKLVAMKRRLKYITDDQRVQYEQQYKAEKAKYKRSLLKTKSSAWRAFCSTQTTTFGPLFQIAHNKVFRPHHVLAQWDGTSLTREETLIRLTTHLFPPITDDPYTNRPQTQPLHEDQEPDLNVHEIRTALFLLNEKKAPGPDGIDFRILRHIYNLHPRLINSWVMNSYNLAYFPAILRKGEVVYFNKKGKDPFSPDSYRPICLLPTLGKLLEKIVQRRLAYFMETHNLFSHNQHGFREGRSSETALKELHTILSLNRKNRRYTAVLSLDIKSAFDSVRWSQIVDELAKMSCPPKLYGLISTYLQNRSMLVNWGNGAIEYSISRGCPQGSCLGPILWLVIAETFLRRCKTDEHSTIHAYADDFILTTSYTNRRHLELSGNDLLNQFETWLNDYHLQVSINKCTATTILKERQGKLTRKPIFKLQSTKIPTTVSFTYLGLTFSQKLTWMQHINKLMIKLFYFNDSLNRVTQNHWGASPKLLKAWYQAVTEKIATYAAGIWGGHLRQNDKKKLQSIQRPFLLRIAKCYKTASTPALQTITGNLPLDLAVQKEYLVASLLRLGGTGLILNENFSASDIQSKETTMGSHPADKFILGLHTTSMKPADSPINIYTDGSKTTSGVGMAFCVYQNEDLIYTHSQRLQNHNTVYQAEVDAINQAIAWLEDRKILQANIHTDSLSAIMAIQSPVQRNAQIQSLQSKLKELSRKKVTINIYWIKAHVGNLGNEKADELAKAATSLMEVHKHLKIPPSHIKKQISTMIYKQWQESWDESEKGLFTKNLLPVVSRHTLLSTPWLTSMLLGHGPFPAYLARFNLAVTDQCICGHRGDAQHYLSHCILTKKWHLKPLTKSNASIWLQSVLRSKTLRAKLKALYSWLQNNSDNIQGNFVWPDGM